MQGIGNFDFGAWGFGTSLATSIFGGAAESTLRGLSKSDAFYKSLTWVKGGAKILGPLVSSYFTYQSIQEMAQNPTPGNVTRVMVQGAAVLTSPILPLSLGITVFDFYFGDSFYNIYIPSYINGYNQAINSNPYYRPPYRR
jgi:hypothetical protein